MTPARPLDAPPRVVGGTDPWRVLKILVRVVVAIVLLLGLAFAALVYSLHEAFKDFDHGGNCHLSKVDDDITKRIASSNEPGSR